MASSTDCTYTRTGFLSLPRTKKLELLSGSTGRLRSTKKTYTEIAYPHMCKEGETVYSEVQQGTPNGWYDVYQLDSALKRRHPRTWYRENPYQPHHDATPISAFAFFNHTNTIRVSRGYLSIYRSICLSIDLSVCLSIYLSVSLCLCLPLTQHICGQVHDMKKRREQESKPCL